MRGLIAARIYFHREDEFLDVVERVTTKLRPKRAKYSYHLQYLDQQIPLRYDFDPLLPEGMRHHVN